MRGLYRACSCEETFIAIIDFRSARARGALRSDRDTELLRSELFSIEQLKRHAVVLAEQHSIDTARGPDKLLPRLADNARVLQAAYEVVTSAAAAGQQIAPAEAWMLDNFYLIEQQIDLAHRHLPRGYSRQLPRLAAGPSAGFPRIYDLALQLISHMDGRVDDDNVMQFISAYQTVQPLQLGELWAYPIMLQLALLENLRRVGVRIARRRQERDAAIVWADRLLVTAEKKPKQLIQVLADFANADVPLTAPFVEEFYARLQVQAPTMAFIQTWVEQKLHEQGVTAAQLSEAAGRTAATNQLSVANSIGSLRFIGATDWKTFVERLSVVEQRLRDDPAAMYVEQDFATRDRYRHIVEDLARACSHTEEGVAREAIRLAHAAGRSGDTDRRAHVGYYLIDRGRPTLERALGCGFLLRFRALVAGRASRMWLYIGSIALLTVLATQFVLLPFSGSEFTSWRFGLFLLAGAISTSAFAVALVNLLVTLSLSPRTLARLDFSKGIPDAHRTMVAVPVLLGSAEEIDRLIEALEIRYLGNRDPNVFFALLTDFPDAAEQTLPSDGPLLARLREAISTLNATYRDDRSCIFYLFHRSRTWNPYEGVWMGYERKRGKLEQFNGFLRGDAQDAFSEVVGDVSIFRSIRYVITLDADTQLPRDAAITLVGNMAHPLNRPVYDPVKGRIVEGYAILQPRASISLVSAGQSRFTKLFVGEAGIDPYTRQVSDVYQDLFGEGSFIGKGIYDVDAFRQSVDGRFPENRILSHDLLESGYARSALVTDVDLIEDHPASYSVEASRRHRWIRGDWQLAAWLLPWVPGPSATAGTQSTRQRNPLTALSVWKLFDNLRRSLVPPALLLLLVGGWVIAPSPAWFWTLVVAAVVLLPGFVGLLIELIRKPQERDWSVHLALTSKSAGRPLVLAGLTLVFLPYDALICLDAIFRSGVRMLFTCRGLLLWQLPAYKKRNARRTPSDFIREMWIAPTMAAAVGGYLLWGPLPFVAAEWWLCAPLLLLWLSAPVIGWWISVPLAAGGPELNVKQRLFLRVAARRTWRYFDEFVSAEDNWLPPDNFQEHPDPAIAARTSPTNIGMGLLANLAAYDFGYVSAGDLIRRTTLTLSTMEKLERYRGHFYNWYDTRTLQPLRPQYISSVDSGNLVGSLLTLQAGLMELKDAPARTGVVFEGLQDTLSVLTEHLPSVPAPELAQKLNNIRNTLNAYIGDAPPDSPTAIVTALAEIQRTAADLLAWLPENTDIDPELMYWARQFERQAREFGDDSRAMVPATPPFDQIGRGEDLAPRHTSVGARSCSETAAIDRNETIDELVERCRAFASMDFEFLYDSSRGLLAIGYDVGERRRDPSCYDLLASEARLASFLLIAQGQLPQKHWFALGRLLTSHGGAVSLISWSGSMFEYLMPCLIMPSFENTLLDHTCKAAVSRQIQYGRQRAVPWGISESCYNATDLHQVYQYRAFGVPGLGFKRGLGDDLVVAPYASALALTVAPREACQNLQTLAANGFIGDYGFYEAIDYTPSRVPRGSDHAVVRTFMAHHQGMSLLAFGDVLLGRPMQRRFMSDPLVRATQLLLQERVPKRSATLQPHAAEVTAAARPPSAEVGQIMRVFTDPNTTIPEVHLLSNGKYHVMATQAGGGYSRWQNLAVTRWREDATRDCWGTFIYLRERATGRYWSAAHQPTLRKADHYEAIFVQARAEYRRRDQAIETHTEISVSPEDDVEIRRVTLTNLSARIRHIELTSYAEVVLAPLNADMAHRAFSNLFVQTEILQDQQAILCTRRPRTAEDQVPWMFHLLAAPGVVAGEPSFETDRAKFIGRGRTAENPIALDSADGVPRGSARLSNTDGAVLDPIVSIRRNITLSPDGSATVSIISGVAHTREAALGVLEKYCDRHFVERAFEMAWFQSHEVLRHINAVEADAQIFGRLATSVIYANVLRRAAPSVIARNRLGQSGLWRFGISGDLPIVLVRIGNLARMDLVKTALQAHSYWRMKGLAADLVIVNEDFSGYRAVMQDEILGLVNGGQQAHMLDEPGGIFIRRADELSEDERVLLQTVARIVFSDRAQTLIEQVERRVSPERASDRLELPAKAVAESVQPLAHRERILCNGLGGFTPDGREYVITLEPGQTTPAPWANVIASPHIGTVVSESGGAYTWVENAHEFRLTTWHNDPLSDSSGEALYIRDEETGVFWSPTPLPARGRTGYVCRHGFGYSVFEHSESGISSTLSVYVAIDAPVKFAVVKLCNHSKRSRRLSVTGYWELVMGEWRHVNLMHIVTEMDPQTGAVFASNAFGREYAGRVAFAQVSETEMSITGNRTEFIGRNGSLANPAAMGRARFSGHTGAARDPCAAIQTTVELAEGEEREIVFVFGAAANTDEAQQLVQRFSGPARARQALEAVWEYWNRTLGAVQVQTPDRALDVMANGWLVYQTLACRFWGRSGYYQSGGAYGYRDQLQDTMALIHTTPELAREQLLRCGGRQFPQGDVQHWWHPPSGQGVRTHFSDDYLWLPYAACRYVLATGDTGVLDEPVHFLVGRELNAEEEAYYDQPQRSTETATLYEHCVRAVEHGLRFGSHQLPLIGCGDWNDGMNRIGRAGKGESVWLAWFLYDVLTSFAGLARSRGDEAFSTKCQEQAEALRTNIESQAWDGNWYRRAYFDDGTPLGSATNDECQIDSISQSWAIISGAGEPERARKAMAAVNERLVRRDAKLIQLLSPPFDKSDLEPGYIKGYVPGVRENGGQYTHAAIWTVMAFAMMRRSRTRMGVVRNAESRNHGARAEESERYKVEPYVMCADIYAAPPHTGRGGWTWYTGAAGWMYRLTRRNAARCQSGSGPSAHRAVHAGGLGFIHDALSLSRYGVPHQRQAGRRRLGSTSPRSCSTGSLWTPRYTRKGRFRCPTTAWSILPNWRFHEGAGTTSIHSR